jgi:hypothetical protein
MVPLKTLSRSLAVLISLAIATAPLAAQQKAVPQPSPQRATPQKPTPPTTAKKTTATDQATATIDNLLAADSFKIYGEIRNVGQLVRSANITDVLDPIMKLAAPPKEFKALVNFTNAHAESLATARMMIATWPAKPKLPQFLVAIEFASPDEAQKFEPQLREVMPKIMPTPTPTPVPEPASATPEEKPSTGDKKSEPVAVVVTAKSQSAAQEPKTVGGSPAEEKPAPPPFVIKQIGNLVLLSDTAFNIKSLRPPGSTLLTENENFRHAHDRFVSEPIFIFFNVALTDKVQEAMEKQAAADSKAREAEQSVKPEEVMVGPETDIPEGDQPQPEVAVIANPTTDPQTQTTSTLSVQTPQKPDPIDLDLNQLERAIFGGQPKWPEAVGAAISLDGDGYVARVLLVNGLEGKASPIPFFPQLVSGPAIAPESPTILPADTEMFITTSIDAPQMYVDLVKTMIENNAREETYRRPSKGAQPPQAEAPFAALEKQLGIKLKEDLVPILGNEVAITLPVSTLMGTDSSPKPEPSPSPGAEGQAKEKNRGPSPVVLISLKDKQAARLLLPRIIEGLGFKGAGMLAQTERREETEIVSYANAFAYAFIGNFLVLSTDAASTRHVVDSYLSHQTLSADSHYRNSVRWQPRQVIGQVYLSPALMESYRTFANAPSSQVTDKLREFFQRLSPEAEPVTYALSSEGPGPLHELHVPKNLLLMAIAGIAGEAGQSPLRSNEGMARMALSSIARAEQQYRDDKDRGVYGTLDQLIAEGEISKDFLEGHGYRIELTVTGTKFEATAVPLEYGTTGLVSFFIDETGIMRGADHGGSPASVADQPAE